MIGIITSIGRWVFTIGYGTLIRSGVETWGRMPEGISFDFLDYLQRLLIYMETNVMGTTLALTIGLSRR